MTAFICVPMLSGCSKTKSVSTEITVEKAAKKVKQFQSKEPLRLKKAEESKLKVMATSTPCMTLQLKIGGDKVKVMDMVSGWHRAT